MWSLGEHCFFVLTMAGGTVQAQMDASVPYGSRNKFGVVGEYSNDSSHIILGTSENVNSVQLEFNISEG